MDAKTLWRWSSRMLRPRRLHGKRRRSCGGAWKKGELWKRRRSEGLPKKKRVSCWDASQLLRRARLPPPRPIAEPSIAGSRSPPPPQTPVPPPTRCPQPQYERPKVPCTATLERPRATQEPPSTAHTAFGTPKEHRAPCTAWFGASEDPGASPPKTPVLPPACCPQPQ